MKKGFFGIGVYGCKTEVNVGTLYRSAYNFGADFIFTIGRRYKSQASDTTCTERHIPLYNYITFADFKKNLPKGARIVAIELDENAKELKTFEHPKQAVYLLGAEDHGIPKDILKQCHEIVQFKTPYSLNVAVAGSIAMYDRVTKAEK